MLKLKKGQLVEHKLFSNLGIVVKEDADLPIIKWQLNREEKNSFLHKYPGVPTPTACLKLVSLK